MTTSVFSSQIKYRVFHPGNLPFAADNDADVHVSCRPLEPTQQQVLEIYHDDADYDEAIVRAQARSVVDGVHLSIDSEVLVPGWRRTLDANTGKENSTLVVGNRSSLGEDHGFVCMHVFL